MKKAIRLKSENPCARRLWIPLSLTVILLSVGVGCSSSSTRPSEGAAEDAVVSDSAPTDPLPATTDSGSAELAAEPVQDPAATGETKKKKRRKAEPVADVATTGETEIYEVQKGDTLMKIAFERYGNLYQWKSIYSRNQAKIPNPGALPAGLKLEVEKTAAAPEIARNGEKYEIRPGDTLASISKGIYGTYKKWKQLWENNRQLIRDPNRIFAGFYLYYTMSEEERTLAEKAKAQPFTGDSARAPAAAKAAAPATK